MSDDKQYPPGFYNSDGERVEPKVVDLERPPSESEKALAYLERNHAEAVQAQRWAAKMHRQKYLACIDEGFSPEQALEICKTIRI